jgi:hypothetical protein
MAGNPAIEAVRSDKEKGTTLADSADAWQEGQRNVAWADAHADELRQYAGQWLCIADQRIVVAERDSTRFDERLNSEPHTRPGRYILYVPTADELATLHLPVRVAAPRRE